MRYIDTIFWHCSATPEGREHTVEDIDGWHKDNGWSGIGYHWVVYIDGSVHAGRPESEVGAHAKDHNTGSLGFCYIGGTDQNGSPKDTRNEAQRAAMEKLTAEKVKQYEIKEIWGHRDVSNKACPCFDAHAEYQHLLTIAELPGQQIVLVDRVCHAFAWPSFTSYKSAVPPGQTLNVDRFGVYKNDVHFHEDEATWYCVIHAGEEYWIHEQDVQ